MTVPFFVWGFLGSLFVDVAEVIPFYHETPIAFPERYRRKSYYALRIAVGVMGGALVYAYHVTELVLALNIGASAPLIVQHLANGVKSTTAG